MNYVDEEQMDVMAFEMGQTRLRGSRFADKVENVGRNIVGGLQAASQDQEGIGDDILRAGGKVLQGVGTVANLPGIKQGLQVLDAPFHYGSKLAGAAAERMGVDPRLGEWTVRAGELATGVGALKKAPKAAGKISGKLVDEVAEWGIRNAPEGSWMRLMSDTGGGIVPASKQTKAYLKWDKDALKHFEKTGSMKGYRNYTDPATGLVYRKGMESGKLKNIGLAGRRERGARRNKTTKIDKDKVTRLMEKYNQPPEMAGEFLEYQRVRKRSLDDNIKKINERIKKNPKLYLDEDGKVLKASLGHGKAAKGYTDSADVITNIDIENYRRNVKRSNLDEVSDEFNRGLGRSIDLEEEVLKFLDKDLRDFHRTGGGLKLGRHQQDRIIDYVRRHKNVDIDWKSERSPSGKQLFKSKEEFLQNEATQLFRGDKHAQTMYDLKSRGF